MRGQAQWILHLYYKALLADGKITGTEKRQIEDIAKEFPITVSVALKAMLAEGLSFDEAYALNPAYPNTVPIGTTKLTFDEGPLPHG